VLHEEYQAIIDSGAFLQVDDAVLMHEADTMLSRGQSWEEYRDWARLRVDALNHALRGLPEDRIRYHVCFGSWHGPHAYDPPLRDSVDLVLAVNAKYYLMEQANPRHEHEWKIWEDVPLPERKVLVPGVVTHHTNVVEHPELVAQRLIRLAGVVGRERVMGGTDCGFAPEEVRRNPKVFAAYLGGQHGPGRPGFSRGSGNRLTRPSPPESSRTGAADPHRPAAPRGTRR
jgi:5-methyltetrahydropteroyltriglutamate--homocysteine methyltransferase